MKDIAIRTIGWTIFGCVFCIMFYGTIIAITLSDTDINTSHNLTLNTDDQTRDALGYLSKIKEFEVKENDLYCKNQLLNQSMEYEKKISEEFISCQAALNSLENYYKVQCRNSDGSFREDCFN